MAELIPFHFREGNSLPHRLDPRAKIFAMAALTLQGLHSGPPGNLILTLCLLLCLFHMGVSAIGLVREIRMLAPLLMLVVAGQAISTPEGPEILRFAGLTFSAGGLSMGLLVSWRLCLMMLLGMIFVASTRPAQIRGAVAWLFAPVPGVDGKKIGTMIALMVRFAPIILDQARETRDAMRSRCLENSKNPIRRVTRMCIPVIRRIFQDADHLAMAMEARCYTENRSDPPLFFTRRDPVFMGLVGILCLLIQAGESLISAWP